MHAALACNHAAHIASTATLGTLSGVAMMAIHAITPLLQSTACALQVLPFCAHVTVLCPRKSKCGRALTCRIGPFVCVRGQGGQSARGLQMWHMLPTKACTNTARHYRVPSCTQTGCRCKHKGREMTALPLWHTTASPHLLHKVWPEHSGEHCGKRAQAGTCVSTVHTQAHLYGRCERRVAHKMVVASPGRICCLMSR